jgi:hypothetical protein
MPKIRIGTAITTRPSLPNEQVVIGIPIAQDALDTIPDPPYMRKERHIVGPQVPWIDDEYIPFTLYIYRQPDRVYLVAYNETQRQTVDQPFYETLYDLSRQTLEPLGLWDKGAFGRYTVDHNYAMAYL